MHKVDLQKKNKSERGFTPKFSNVLVYNLCTEIRWSSSLPEDSKVDPSKSQ